MIFVTVGTQGQFNRLIRAVDEWAGLKGRTDVFAQTGQSDYRPKYIGAKAFIDADEFRKNVEAADVVISHAGMGTIITALELGKQIVVMPRRAELGEHRNNHQVATAKQFGGRAAVSVVADEKALTEALDKLEPAAGGARLGSQASPDLINAIRIFISAGDIHFANSGILDQTELDGAKQ